MLKAGFLKNRRIWKRKQGWHDKGMAMPDRYGKIPPGSGQQEIRVEEGEEQEDGIRNLDSG
jgi:hypothetical protein